MAKSLRSKRKLAHRTVKRHDPKSDYAVAEAARVNALSARLTKSAKEDPDQDQDQDQDQDEMQTEESNPTTTTENASNNQKEAAAKVSTSAPRGSRHESWRKIKKAGKGAKSNASATGRTGNKGHRRRR